MGLDWSNLQPVNSAIIVAAGMALAWGVDGGGNLFLRKSRPRP
jgi:hypothetical protein